MIFTDVDKREAQLYYDRDAVRKFTLSSLFEAAVYSLLSIGQLYKVQMDIYRTFFQVFACPHEVLENKLLLKSIICRTRFSRNVEKYILDLCERWDNEIKHLFAEVLHVRILGNTGGKDLREKLVKAVKGFGYKVASLFLDILGFTDVAVVDVWAIRYLLDNGFDIKVMYDSRRMIKSLSKKEYLRCEKLFAEMAEKYACTLAFFQCMLWVKLSSWNKRNHDQQQLFSFWYNLQN